MAAIALPRPMNTILRSIFDDERTPPLSQGKEGQCVRAAAFEAADHWSARPSVALGFFFSENPFSYDPIPLKEVGTVRVIYRHAGRLQPLPFRVD